MDQKNLVQSVLLVTTLVILLDHCTEGMNTTEKRRIKEKVQEMFYHGYRNYMEKAYPADELMPLTCQGRYRGSHQSRGDVDDILGNFSLTLIDTLDTLAIMGDVAEFDKAVRLVIKDVKFDADVIVSTFETNIRVLGGLLGGHVAAVEIKKMGKGMRWYNDELLDMASEVGTRLMPAFNTSTGIPYPRINLRHGIKFNVDARETCTACAGTMILEFAALSRLTGQGHFEAAAKRAMDYLWQQRHRVSDLMGTVLNIHNGEWVRRDSGVGAGIDSYYEYLLKAYILLGEETYLDRFNKHYESIMKYISQGPLMVDVHMHKPLTNSRNFMDALLAFWPGLQVLKGDIKPAIETHEMLYQVTQRHKFLPEAFTTDFRVHWSHHPLRPEFIESTYFLYKATGDPYYLDVGKTVVDNLEKHAKVKCGFAAIRDVTTGTHADQMDSFVLAETFKYLYLLFTEPEEQLLNIDEFIFTTEAHILPLSLSMHNADNYTHVQAPYDTSVFEDDENFERTCPNSNFMFPGNSNYAHTLRSPLKNFVENLCPKPVSERRARLRAGDFMAGNKQQVQELTRMGIRIITMKDGRVQLLHTASEATTADDAEDGMLFMQEMIELSKNQQQEVQQEPRMVQLLTTPFLGHIVYKAGPAQFGLDLKDVSGVTGELIIANPFRGCMPLKNAADARGKIVMMERGDCMFIDKARHLMTAGAVGGVVIDHNVGTSSETAPLFAMSGDGKTDVDIPLVFLFHRQGEQLKSHLHDNPVLRIMLAEKASRPDDVMRDMLRENLKKKAMSKSEPDMTVSMPTMDTNTDTSSLTEESVDINLKDENVDMPTTDSSENQDTATSAIVKKLWSKYLGKVNLKNVKGSVQPKVPLSKEEETLLKIIEGPDNNRQISLSINAYLMEQTENKINRVYEEMVRILQSYTNFDALDEQKEYLEILAKLIESAFMDIDEDSESAAGEALNKLNEEIMSKRDEHKADKTESHNINPESQVEIDLGKLTNRLTKAVEYMKGALPAVGNKAMNKHSPEEPEIQPEEPEIQSEKKSFRLEDEEHEGQHYASQEEFLENAPQKSTKLKYPNIRQAPEWMKLRNSEIFVGRDGIVYVKNFKEATKNIMVDDNGAVEETTDTEKNDNPDDSFLFMHEPILTSESLHLKKPQEDEGRQISSSSHNVEKDILLREEFAVLTDRVEEMQGGESETPSTQTLQQEHSSSDLKDQKEPHSPALGSRTNTNEQAQQDDDNSKDEL